MTDRATPATPTPSASDAGPRLLDGRVVLTSAPLLVGAFGADASAGIERDAYDPRGAWAQRGARARTWAGGPTGGTWFGLGVTAPTRAGTTPRATEWQLGGWTQRGSILLSALLRSVATQGLADDTAPTGGEDSTWIDPTTQQVHHTNKRATGAVTPSAARSARGATDAIVGAGWMWGRAALHARLGRRLAVRGGAGVSSGSATWAGVGATLPPVGPLALGLDYVRQPADVVRGIPAAERFFAGLRWVPRPRSVAADDGPAPARPAGLRPRETEVRVPPGAAPGVRTLVVALGIVGSAEVQGDFTAWRPVALRPVGDGTWAADVVLAPGVHTLAVRTDGGAWRAPPGLPSADDAFGGVVGTLIVDSSPPATGP